MQYFDEKFKVSSIGVNLLPVFHSCDAFSFREMLDNRKLTLSEDQVFENEKLLYFFYGRPAYKTSNQESSTLNSFLPVSLILKSESLIDIKRIAPFDTGAFKGGLYKDYLHPKMQLSSFFLTPEINTVRKAISYFFGTNENYFKGIPVTSLEYDKIEFEIESFHKLISGPEQRVADDRKATFEIQLEQEFQLTCASLEAVILPEHFLSSEFVRNTLVDELKAEAITYECYGIPSSDNYSHVLYLAKQYLIRNNYLS